MEKNTPFGTSGLLEKLYLGHLVLWVIGLFQINCAIPNKGGQRIVRKKSGIPLAIQLLFFSWKSRLRKRKSLDFGCMWIYFPGNLTENKDFRPKKPEHPVL